MEKESISSLGTAKENVQSRRDEILRIALLHPDQDMLPRIGAIQVLTCCAIDKLGGHAYAAQIAEWMRENFRPDFSDGQTVDTLKGLRERGMLEASEYPMPKGRPAIFHTLTKRGRILIDEILPLFLSS